MNATPRILKVVVYLEIDLSVSERWTELIWNQDNWNITHNTLAILLALWMFHQHRRVTANQMTIFICVLLWQFCNASATCKCSCYRVPLSWVVSIWTLTVRSVHKLATGHPSVELEAMVLHALSVTLAVAFPASLISHTVQLQSCELCVPTVYYKPARYAVMSTKMAVMLQLWM